MASLSKHHGGWLIQYTCDGKRKSFYPGVMPKRDAQNFVRHLENLLSSQRQRTGVADETAAWVNAQTVATRGKLFDHGLIEKPVELDRKAALAEFVDTFIATRKDVKATTKTVWRRSWNHLIAYFGADCNLSTIGQGEAKDFRQHLLGTGMAENTVRKMCSVASQFFTDASERGLIDRNPFAQKSIPRTTRENRTRDCFITREMACKVLDACPDAQWKLLFALSRFGGLRCPSEHLSLKWTDILWDQEKIIVTSPKTAHHEGKEQRVIPLFPELKPFLEAAFQDSPDDAGYLITRYRKTETNLRTQLHRIIRAAGLTPWEKVFHNLRASRETELAESFPIHVVCAWIGNNPTIAAKHYLQVTEDHFSRAVDAMQIAMQNMPESGGIKEKRDQEELQKPSVFPAYSSQFRSKPHRGMVTTGLEPATFCV